MAKTYTPGGTKQRDMVRLLIADNTTGKMHLADEEIDAMLVRESNNTNLAAAACGELLIARHGNTTEKRVGDLQLRFSEEPDSVFAEYLTGLRERGAQELLPSQSHFVVL